MIATKEFLKRLDEISETRKREILSSEDRVTVTGNTYYVSNAGNDENDGTAPERAWKTLARVSAADLLPGDGVRFCRGDLFRGFLETREGVTYAAYGEGEKPRFYGWEYDLADPTLWELADAEHHIWKMKNPILDCGTLVFDEGAAHCRKLIPSYIGGHFVCREDESRPFEMAREMTQDLDMVCFYEERMTTQPSKGQDFPVPLVDFESYGSLFLRCDKGNPGALYRSIEALPKRNMILIRNHENVTVDNLCLKYIGAHAIGAGGAVVKGLHVSNCEIGWIGGSIQHYMGTDPNYPEGGRGTVTRYGNAIEIYGGCEDYLVENCYIYQVYDAGITHQITTGGRTFTMTNIRYQNNLIEYCVYSIEYFLEKTAGDTESYIEDCEMSHNILRFSGFGWGQQRHNTHTPAHIKGWSYENTARDYRIHDNLFDRAAYRMLHLVAKEETSLPKMWNNVYVQKANATLGQYGANRETEPPMLMFDEKVEKTVEEILCDRGARVYRI